MNITLLHGVTGNLVALLGCFGVIALADLAWDWAGDRFTVTWGPVRVYRRWDRPGQMVLADDGREVAILCLVRDKDAGDMAVIRSYDEDEDELWPPEWVSLATLSPLPARVKEAV
jgi:hypothetical protein